MSEHGIPTDVETIGEMVDRLWESGDEERHAALSELARSPERWSELRDGLAILAAIGGRSAARELDEATIALELAAGRVRREVLGDWPRAEWVLESLRTEALLAEGATPSASASETTRARIAALTARRPRRRSGWQVAAVLIGVLVLGGTALWFAPADEGWAAQLQLSRGERWAMGAELRGAVAAAVDEGRLSAPAFEIPEAPLRLERDDFRGDAPRVAYPRWERVRDGRPTFRWDSEASGRFEVVLLDQARRVVWSRAVEQATSLGYPDDEAPLDPGATYYWKVNREVDGRLLASAYAGLRPLAPAERSTLVAELRRAGGAPFVRGVVLDRHGLYAEAQRSFERDDSDRGRRAAEAMRARRGLGE